MASDVVFLYKPIGGMPKKIKKEDMKYERKKLEKNYVSEPSADGSVN